MVSAASKRLNKNHNSRHPVDERHGQCLTEIPDRVRVWHAIGEHQPMKAHELNDNRSLIRYSVRSSGSEWLACKIKTLNIRSGHKAAGRRWMAVVKAAACH